MKSPTTTTTTTTTTTNSTITNGILEKAKNSSAPHELFLTESLQSRSFAKAQKYENNSDKMSANTIASSSPVKTVTATTTTKYQQETVIPRGTSSSNGLLAAPNDSETKVIPSQKAAFSEATQAAGTHKLAAWAVHSSSQDENDSAEKRRRHGEKLQAHEHRSASISPIFPEPVGSTSSLSSRFKFRKSHTCGSLFANCSCSATAEPMPIPLIHNVIPATEGLTERRQPLAALPLPMQLSLSPTNADLSTASSGLGASIRSSSGTTTPSRWLSEEGRFSFSTNTTNTSMQLSRDDDDDDNAEDYSSKNAWSSLVGETPAKSAHTAAGGSSANRKLKSTRISTTSPGLEVPSIRALESPVSLSRDGSTQRTSKRLFQSYSHPDTDFIFTDENKRPTRESVSLSRHQNVTRTKAGTVITSRDGQIACRHAKRSSSPNIGDYQTLDVAVHPDLLVKVSPRHSPSAWIEQSKCAAVVAAPLHSGTRSAQQRRRWLQRSKEIQSGGSTSDSEHSFEAVPPETTPGPAATRVDEKSTTNPISPTVTEVEIQGNTRTVSPEKDEEESLKAAQRYFAESGILGPINPSSNLIRKTSKILQDANVIEKIRKTSQILRANAIAINQIKTSVTNLTIQALGVTTTPPTTPNHSTSGHMEQPTAVAFAQEATVPTSPESPKSSKSPKSPKSPHAMAATCGFSPNLTTQNCCNTNDRDALIKSLQGEMVSLRDVLKSRDAQILKLRREIHKLKSVLQQTTQHIPIVHDELLQSPADDTKPSAALEVTKGLVNRSPPIACAFCQRKIDLEGPASDSSSNGSSSSDSTTSEYFTCGSATSIPNINQSNGCSDNSNIIGSPIRHSLSTAATTTTLNSSHSASCTPAASHGNSNGSTAASAGPSAVMQAIAVCTGSSPPLAKPTVMPMLPAPVLKKQGVSGESCETSMQQSINEPILKFEKDFSSKQLIKDAIMDNDFLKNIDASQVRELVESMYSLSVAQGQFVIREGEAGAHLYVSAAGEFEVMKNGKVLGTMGSGKAFGELAILYNCTRTASVRVLSDARVWVLDRRVFQQIMMRTGMQRLENSMNFLKSVPLLRNLSEGVLAKIADVLEVEFYPAGTYIIRQGASGDTFFLISQGTVKVTQKLGPNCVETEIRMLQRGDYFGEQALINEDKRTANIIALAPGVECLTLDRESFTHLIGDLSELKEKDYGDDSRVLALKCAQTKEVFGANVKQELPDMRLTDLEVVGTLGIGGFGRVELVKTYKQNRVDIFALKCLKKRHIVDTKQEEHIFSERTIMLTCQTPFICRLYRTFRDEKYVYMLLEACMGGEVWTMLRDRGCFDENATQFIIGCVLQAFEYLHARGIIYRDLKPENLMMDEKGYVKLVDFGFAKYIGNTSKTWTFCGTPEYVAPEIILNKGHDRAVDYWALGILIHELLNGTPPFTSNDPMKTYNIILKGIDMIDFPKHMTRSAVQVIKKLCRDVPAERLGYQKGGIQDIKKHKWFLGFDWDGLQQQLLIPPFVRPIAHPADTSYFDRFPCDPDEPPDELSGWDVDF